MCQTGGPRCTPHVRAQLAAAIAKRDRHRDTLETHPNSRRRQDRAAHAEAKVAALQAEYDSTPGGQHDLAEARHNETDPIRRHALDERRDAGRLMRAQILARKADNAKRNEKGDDDDHQQSERRSGTTDPGTAGTVLAPVGMEPGSAAGPTQGDRAGVDGHGHRTGRVPRLLIADRDVTPIAVHQPPGDVAARLRSEGKSAPPMYELDSGDASIFRSQIDTLKQNNRFAAAVYVYDEEEYSRMRMLVTDDGKSGLALKGDDIVSVFAHRDTAHPHAVNSMLATAVAAGGRRLDCFDTVLPAIYARSGFVPVARLRWNDEYAPDGWDRELYSQYNHGRPDVVYMAYDPNAIGSQYRRGTGAYVETPDDGERASRGYLPQG